MKQNKTAYPRIFHGPENICGIGRYLADWQREKKHAQSDFIVFNDNTNRQNSHRNLRLREENIFLRIYHQVRFFWHSLQDFDIFHFYFGKSLLPLNLDLPILRIAGKSILMTYVGSDVRLENVEKQRNPYYHLRGSNYEKHDLLKRARMIWHGIWCNYCLVGARLVIYAKTSIPQRKIINDIWITKTIELPSAPPEYHQTKKPVIVHAPTNYQKKGTKYIQEAIDALKDEGLEFEFRIFHKIPHDKFINLLRNDADIVVDQLLSGGYGTFSMEGMAYGKPVCCFVTEDVRAQIPDLPIVQSTIDTIQANLRKLILNPEVRERVGKEGWDFARKHFDRDIISEKLWQVYLKLWRNQ